MWFYKKEEKKKKKKKKEKALYSLMNVFERKAKKRG